MPCHSSDSAMFDLNQLYAITWWRHEVETFSALLALGEGNSSVTSYSPSQRPVTRNFAVFFDVHQNKRLSKQLRRRWFETPSHPLWRHCNDFSSIWFQIELGKVVLESLVQSGLNLLTSDHWESLDDLKNIYGGWFPKPEVRSFLAWRRKNK